jgi:hypothetical protein
LIRRGIIGIHDHGPPRRGAADQQVLDENAPLIAHPDNLNLKVWYETYNQLAHDLLSLVGNISPLLDQVVSSALVSQVVTSDGEGM